MKTSINIFYFLLLGMGLCAQQNKVDILENNKELKLDDVIFKEITLPESIYFSVNNKSLGYFVDKDNFSKEDPVYKSKSSFIFLPGKTVILLKNYVDSGIYIFYRLKYSVEQNQIIIQIPKFEGGDISIVHSYDKYKFDLNDKLKKHNNGKFLFIKSKIKDQNLNNYFARFNDEWEKKHDNLYDWDLKRSYFHNDNAGDKIILKIDNYNQFPNFVIDPNFSPLFRPGKLTSKLSSETIKDDISLLINSGTWNKFISYKSNNQLIEKELENYAIKYSNFLINEIPSYDFSHENSWFIDNDFNPGFWFESWAQKEVRYAYSLTKDILNVSEKTKIRNNLFSLYKYLKQNHDLNNDKIISERSLKYYQKKQFEYLKAKKRYDTRIKEFELARIQAIKDFEKTFKRKQNSFERNIFDGTWATEKKKILKPEKPGIPGEYHSARFPAPPKELPDEYQLFIQEYLEEKSSENVEYEPQKLTEQKTTDPAEEEIFTVCETPAEFPGGPQAFNEFLKRNLRPYAATRPNVGGKVYVQFVVNKDGTIQDVQVLKSLDLGCDEEAIRVIKSIPRWTPGKQSDRPVRSRKTLSITFNY